MKLAPHCPVKYGFDPSAGPPTVPDNAQSVGHFTESFDHRLWMFHRLWEPEGSSEIKATLMIVHGTVDHSGVYREMALQLNRAGIAVVAMDMRGWGLSDGESMYVDDLEIFMSDVDALYRHVHETPRYKNVKERFLLGKSLGGLVTAFCAAKYPEHWTGLIGLSGAYQLDKDRTVSPLAAEILTWAAWLMPKKPLKKLFPEELIVSDPKALQAWRDDKLCCKDKVRLGYVAVGYHGMKKLAQDLVEQIDLPMLMMWGDDDHVVALSGHEMMVEKSPNKDTKLKIYKGGRHNLLQEPALKEEVTRDIREWILANVEE